MTKVIFYIATSSDGFIADENGSVDWLPSVNPAEDYGYNELLNRINIICMGRKSYEQIIDFGDWAWNDKNCYIFSSNIYSHENKKIRFINESPEQFVKKISLEHSQQNIWLLGGAELAHAFAEKMLIDECIITIIPAKLKNGIPLELPTNDFDLIESKNFADNIIQQKYLLKKNQ